MRLILDACRPFGVEVAQLLMSAEDVENRRRFLSARHTMRRLLDAGIVPIINENDALADDELKVGDNDHLAALVASVISAEALVILSNVDGLRRDAGEGPVIRHARADEPIDSHVGAACSASGVGGMAAKLSAARLAASRGVPTLIASGLGSDALSALAEGSVPPGTMIVPTAWDPIRAPRVDRSPGAHARSGTVDAVGSDATSTRCRGSPSR